MRTEIRVQAYAFSSRPIATALKAAHDRSIDVQVVVDRSNERYRGGVTDGLVAAGVPALVDWAPAIAHSKVMIVLVPGELADKAGRVRGMAGRVTGPLLGCVMRTFGKSR